MQTKNGFTLMSVAEFEKWIKNVKVSRKIDILQVHHTYSPSFAQFNGSNHFNLQQGMKSYHVNQCHYSDIAQNFTVFPDGTIMTGRSLNLAPAGARGMNTTGICVENLGNFDKGGDVMPAVMKNAIVRIYAAMVKRFNINIEKNIRYHAWYTASGTYLGNYVAGRSCKTCPGTNFFGGCTRAAYDANFRPLIKKAVAGSYVEEDEEVVKSIKVFNCGNDKTVTVSVVPKDNGGTNYIKMRDIETLGGKVGYGNGMPSIDLAPEVSRKVILNGKTVEAPAVFSHGTNYIAIRDILEVLGVPSDAITWDKATGSIKILGNIDIKYSPEDETK